MVQLSRQQYSDGEVFFVKDSVPDAPPQTFDVIMEEDKIVSFVFKGVTPPAVPAPMPPRTIKVLQL
jgi:hypothetical protein